MTLIDSHTFDTLAIGFGTLLFIAIAIWAVSFASRLK
jgi:hypothetical protein